MGQFPLVDRNGAVLCQKGEEVVLTVAENQQKAARNELNVGVGAECRRIFQVVDPQDDDHVENAQHHGETKHRLDVLLHRLVKPSDEHALRRASSAFRHHGDGNPEKGSNQADKDVPPDAQQTGDRQGALMLFAFPFEMVKELVFRLPTRREKLSSLLLGLPLRHLVDAQEEMVLPIDDEFLQLLQVEELRAQHGEGVHCEILAGRGKLEVSSVGAH
mmetsp:Transcript_20230/g.56096  ORF Transcript_20230/g.56096 Transcript_20230/m.56096 type:complete len:217 (-) Transcript_20230:1147-1797(-)